MAETNSEFVKRRKGYIAEQKADYPNIGHRAIDWLADACNRIEQLEKAIEKHRWIPVGERLPGDKPSVDIYLDNGNRVTTFNFAEHWENHFAPLKITHWKPIILPEQAEELIKPAPTPEEIKPKTHSITGQQLPVRVSDDEEIERLLEIDACNDA